MSEKDELIETITEIVREECIATGRGEDGRDSGELRDDLRDLIDAAVAPLVAELEKARDFIATLPQDCMGTTGMDMTSEDGQRGYMTWPIRDEWLHNASQALTTWRK